MGSCLDILEEEEQEITNKEGEIHDQEVSLSLHEMAEDDHSAETNSKMQTARLKPLVRSNGLQRDNSTKEADPSGRIFRQVLPLQNGQAQLTVGKKSIFCDIFYYVFIQIIKKKKI